MYLKKIFNPLLLSIATVLLGATASACHNRVINLEIENSFLTNDKILKAELYQDGEFKHECSFIENINSSKKSYEITDKFFVYDGDFNLFWDKLVEFGELNRELRKQCKKYTRSRKEHNLISPGAVNYINKCYRENSNYLVLKSNILNYIYDKL